MRYSLTEGAFILSKFNTGSSITISLYKLSDSSVVTLTSNVMSEISTTGVFKWNTSNITTQPTSFIEYLWIATDGTSSQYGKIVLGGYPTKVEEEHKLLGLDASHSLTITKTQQSVDNIVLNVNESVAGTIVTRQ